SMKFADKSPRDAFSDADWVCHLKIESSETLDEHEHRQGMNDVRYGVQHLEVFKKPSPIDELPAEVYGSTVGGPVLEEGKEYLLCGSLLNDVKLSCVAGQVKPEDVKQFVAEWDQISEEFIEEMKTFDQ
ncbi:hypothetical protein PENTCL1PPCAC_12418, partial [Pristionchus entomophagus]